MSTAGPSPRPQGRPKDAGAPDGGCEPVEHGGSSSGANHAHSGGREAPPAASVGGSATAPGCPGHPPPDGGSPLTDALGQLLADRWSCRAFLPREVDRPTVELILALAQRTASWCNAQPWQIIVTSGAATGRFRDAMLNVAMAAQAPRPDFPYPREYPGVYQLRRRACGFQLYDSVGIAHGDRQASARQTLENFRLFGAPHVAIVTTPEALGVYGAIDCGAYVSNFMLAAQALGIAAIAQAALASFPDAVRAHFGLPDERRVVCGISFGYADDAHPVNRYRTPRAAIDEVVTWAEQ